MRAAALHLDRYRAAIEAEVDRRLGRSEPSPHARAEIVRRFRTFCRLASIDLEAARPSFDGLGGTPAGGLEQAVARAVEVACECDPSDEVTEALRELEVRFRAGIRRVMQPSEAEPKAKRRRRKTPNAGRRVRAAIDRIGDAYVALCLDTGRIFDANPAAETLFGVEAAELLKLELQTLVSQHDRSQFQDLESRLDAGEDTAPLVITFVRPGGGTITTELSVSNHTIGGRRLAILVLRERLPEQPLRPQPNRPSLLPRFLRA